MGLARLRRGSGSAVVPPPAPSLLLLPLGDPWCLLMGRPPWPRRPLEFAQSREQGVTCHTVVTRDGFCGPSPGRACYRAVPCSPSGRPGQGILGDWTLGTGVFRLLHGEPTLPCRGCDGFGVRGWAPWWAVWAPEPSGTGTVQCFFQGPLEPAPLTFAGCWPSRLGQTLRPPRGPGGHPAPPWPASFLRVSTRGHSDVPSLGLWGWGALPGSGRPWGRRAECPVPGSSPTARTSALPPQPRVSVDLHSGSLTGPCPGRGSCRVRLWSRLAGLPPWRLLWAAVQVRVMLAVLGQDARGRENLGLG